MILFAQEADLHEEVGSIYRRTCAGSIEMLIESRRFPLPATDMTTPRPYHLTQEVVTVIDEWFISADATGRAVEPRCWK